MSGSSAGAFLGTNLGGVARQATEPDPVIEAENHVETVTAPAIAATRALAHGPLVEGNLTLTNTATAEVYTLGVDYIEDPTGGFENLTIPDGTGLTADYFYYAEGPLEEPTPVGGGGGAVDSVDGRTGVVTLSDLYAPLYFPLASVVSASRAATADERLLLVDASAGPVTISLPTAADIGGKEYMIKKVDASANAVTIDPAGTETIDGKATISTTFQYDAVTVESDGTNWRITTPMQAGGGPGGGAAAPEDWHEVGAPGEPIFQNGWANYNPAEGYNTAGFYKDSQGRVHIKGLLTGGTVALTTGDTSVIFQLPVGYRPAKHTPRLAYTTDAQDNTVVGRCDVNSDGKIKAMKGANAIYSIDGLSFKAA